MIIISTTLQTIVYKNFSKTTIQKPYEREKCIIFGFLCNEKEEATVLQKGKQCN